MIVVPNSVDLQWIARQLVKMQTDLLDMRSTLDRMALEEMARRNKAARPEHNHALDTLELFQMPSS
jgi:hypothetical protein